jgi:hypothetical protein
MDITITIEADTPLLARLSKLMDSDTEADTIAVLATEEPVMALTMTTMINSAMGSVRTGMSTRRFAMVMLAATGPATTDIGNKNAF